MIITTLILTVSYEIQIITLWPIILNILKGFTPSGTAYFLETSQDGLCIIASLMENFFGIIPLSITLSTLIIARGLRNHFPAVYNGLDHDKVSYRLFLAMFLTCIGTMFVQLITCGTVCRKDNLSNVYLSLQKNETNKTILGSEQYNCWVPFSELSLVGVVIIFSILTLLKIVHRVYLKLRRIHSQQNLLKQENPSMNLRNRLEEASISNRVNSIKIEPALRTLSPRDLNAEHLDTPVLYEEGSRSANFTKQTNLIRYEKVRIVKNKKKNGLIESLPEISGVALIIAILIMFFSLTDQKMLEVIKRTVHICVSYFPWFFILSYDNVGVQLFNRLQRYQL